MHERTIEMYKLALHAGRGCTVAPTRESLQSFVDHCNRANTVYAEERRRGKELTVPSEAEQHLKNLDSVVLLSLACAERWELAYEQAQGVYQPLDIEGMTTVNGGGGV